MKCKILKTDIKVLAKMNKIRHNVKHLEAPILWRFGANGSYGSNRRVGTATTFTLRCSIYFKILPLVLSSVTVQRFIEHLLLIHGLH